MSAMPHSFEQVFVARRSTGAYSFAQYSQVRGFVLHGSQKRTIWFWAMNRHWHFLQVAGLGVCTGTYVLRSVFSPPVMSPAAFAASTAAT